MTNTQSTNHPTNVTQQTGCLPRGNAPFPVRTDLRSGGCPPCQYPKFCLCDINGANCYCGYAKQP